MGARRVDWASRAEGGIAAAAHVRRATAAFEGERELLRRRVGVLPQAERAALYERFEIGERGRQRKRRLVSSTWLDSSAARGMDKTTGREVFRIDWRHIEVSTLTVLHIAGIALGADASDILLCPTDTGAAAGAALIQTPGRTPGTLVSSTVRRNGSTTSTCRPSSSAWPTRSAASTRPGEMRTRCAPRSHCARKASIGMPINAIFVTISMPMFIERVQMSAKPATLMPTKTQSPDATMLHTIVEGKVIRMLSGVKFAYSVTFHTIHARNAYDVAVDATATVRM